MEQYLVVANFACHDYNDSDLYTSQWMVGTFDTLDECYRASYNDLKQVGRDYYEGIVDADEFETEAEVNIAIDTKVLDYVDDRIICSEKSARESIDSYGHAEIISNDFGVSQRQITKYVAYKLTLNLNVR